MTNQHPAPRHDGTSSPVDRHPDVTRARRDRRRRTIYASLAGWALLGAAGTGLVACSSAATTGAAGTGTAAATTAPTTTTAGSASGSGAATSGSAPAGSTGSAASSTPATDAAAAGTYRDGSYTATGTYSSPGGQESVTITLTLAGDTITAASGEGGATQPPSSQYQGEFLDNFAGQIIGKNIDEVSLSKVAGSSLTSGGFNQAVATIKSDARA